ncbi:MAG: hypothetical protein ACODAJ_15685 [Planctomycetota bacterium]
MRAMTTRHISARIARCCLAKALVGAAVLAVVAAPAFGRGQGDRTTFGAKRGKRRETKRPAWLQTPRPTKAGKRRLKRFATMIQRNLEVTNGDLALDLDPSQLDRIDVPRSALALCQRHVKEVNALKDEGYLRFQKQRGGVRVAPTRKLQAALKAVKPATVQGVGQDDMTCQEAWCGYKITVWLNHANTNELLDTLDETQDAMTLVTALCALIPGLQECAPAVAAATAILAIGGDAVENADHGNGVKITVHTTPFYTTLWTDVDPQEVNDGWWPPW